MKSIAKTCFDAIRAKHSAIAAGYNPMVVENHEVYEELLVKVIGASTTEGEERRGSSKTKHRMKGVSRRQSPLINAGYAARVLALSYSIRSFLAYHKLTSSFRKQGECFNEKPDKKRSIRVVFLGCGVDVIGLWTRSLLTEKDDECISLKIIEVDTPEVCSIKWKMLTSQALVREKPMPNETNHSYHTGTITLPRNRFKTGETKGNQALHDYVLIPGDLENIQSLEPILSFSSNENMDKDDCPTLVISELVLSYITQPGTAGVLAWCSQNLCRTADSSLILLEVLGPAKISDPNTFASVEDGYRMDYCQKFHDKLERGSILGEQKSDKSQQRTSFAGHKTSFHPFEGSTESIMTELRKAGFCSRASNVTNLGIVSLFANATLTNQQTMTNAFVSPELFDEHTALILYLRSYVVISGLVDPTSVCMPKSWDCDPWLFRRMMVPWQRRYHQTDLAMIRSRLPLATKLETGEVVIYTEVEACDEDSVRDLFQGNYDKKYTEMYPAIRKLIKNALNKDLSTTEAANSNDISKSADGTQNSTETLRNSIIGDHYRSAGGVFLVAIRYSGTACPGSGATHPVVTSSLQRRRVVGCVGIRTSEGRKIEIISKDNARTDKISMLEIFRLAVDSQDRKKGVGRRLLQALEDHVCARHLHQEEGESLQRIRFVAKTLTILDAAGRTYTSCGYRNHKEACLENTSLVLRTFVKDLPVASPIVTS